MKVGTQILLKLILLTIIILFALFNYRVISFEKGISKTNMNNMSASEVLTTVANISKVEYYQVMKEPTYNGQRPSNYQPSDYIYRVYIVTNQDAYLLKATQDDINAFNTIGLFNKTLTPNKITPIPIYVEIIIGLLVIFIPFGIPKKEKS